MLEKTRISMLFRWVVGDSIGLCRERLTRANTPVYPTPLLAGVQEIIVVPAAELRFDSRWAESGVDTVRESVNDEVDGNARR